MKVVILLSGPITLFERKAGPRFEFDSEDQAKSFCETLGIDYQKVKIVGAGK